MLTTSRTQIPLIVSLYGSSAPKIVPKYLVFLDEHLLHTPTGAAYFLCLNFCLVLELALAKRMPPNVAIF